MTAQQPEDVTLTMKHVKSIASLFYVINPYETMFEEVSDIPKPDWITKVNYILLGLLHY